MAGLTDSHRTILQHELEEALRERGRLDAVIDYLSDRLGVDPTTLQADGGAAAADAPRVDPKEDVIGAVNAGRFYGFTAGRAAREVLNMAGRGRPLRTAEIYTAVKKGGVTIKDAEMLARALKRNKEVMRVGRGLWGLREWYPPNAREWSPGAAELHADVDLEDDRANDEEDEGETETG